MKGHIRQRSKGSWEIFYEMAADPVTGRRRQKSQTVKGAKRDAQRVLRWTPSLGQDRDFIKRGPRCPQGIQC